VGGWVKIVNPTNPFMNQKKMKWGTGLLALSFLLCLISTGSVYPQVYGLDIRFIKTDIDTTTYNNLPAGFPYPVLSLIQIQDRQKHYIHGLAAMDRWLGPDELTEIGLPVDDVWKVITERHRYDDSYPENQNVKEMDPGYMVAELSQVDGYGVSMALAMDYSGSLGTSIKEIEAAAKILIQKINGNDKLAIIKITSDVKIYQDFTSDTTLLMNAVNTPTPDRTGTALNRGIYETIKACKNVTGRRCVVVYTDGLNDMPGPDADAMIRLADSLDVIIFTIGLGPQIDESDLGRIAEETGGYYRRTPSPSSLALIYQQIYNYINGFYALAHTSTDPFFNGTWRRIDVSVHSQNLQGKGWGSYWVPFKPRNVRIQNRVESDSMMVFQGDTLYFATSDDTVQYTLTAFCDGPGNAQEVLIKNVMDRNIRPVSYERAPDQVDRDTLIWKLPRLDGGQQFQIRYQAKINHYLPMETVDLLNMAFISSPFDSINSDNVSVSVLKAKGHPDFQVRCLTPGLLASPGHPLALSAYLSNWGNAHATSPVVVRFYLEDMSGLLIDEITVDSLNYSDSTFVTGIWDSPEPGVHQVLVVADEPNTIKELREDNNSDYCTAHVGVSELDVQISEINYRERLSNRQARFPENIVAKVNVIDQNLHTVFGLADTAQWINLSQLTSTGEPAENHWTGFFETPWNGSADSRADLRNGMQITEVRDDSLRLAFISDHSQSMNGWRQTVQEDVLRIIQNPGDQGALIGAGSNIELLRSFTPNADLLIQSLQTGGNSSNRKIHDACIAGINLLSGLKGRKAVVVSTTGPEQGSQQSMEQLIKVSQDRNIPVFLLQIGDSQISENLKILADTTGGYYFRITHQNQSDMTISFLEDMLRNYYGLSFASPDTLRNETLRVLDVEVAAYGQHAEDDGIYRAPAGYADLAIQTRVNAISEYLPQKGPIGQVQPGDSILYHLNIQNSGHYDLYQISVLDRIPQNLVVDRQSVSAIRINGNEIEWQIDSLGVYDSADIEFVCFVDTLFASPAFDLVSEASVNHERDEFPENNISLDTLLYVPLSGPDLHVYKKGRADSLTVYRQDTVYVADPGDTVTYTIRVVNEGEIRCREIILTDTLSRWLTLTEKPEGAEVDGGIIQWSFGPLTSRGGTNYFSYTCKVDTFVPPWDEMMLNMANVFSPEDTLLDNNSVTDTLWVVGLHPPGPEIQAIPSDIQPGDTISVTVMSPIYIESWDLQVIYEDGSLINNFADDFIVTHPLNPAQWTHVIPGFNDTFMRTLNKKEQIGFIIETRDIWGSIRTDTTFVTMQSNDVFALDRNVFRPLLDSHIQLNIKLSSNRHASLHIYDLSGHHVRELANGPFLAGWNYLQWNGQDDCGRSVGSGVYLAVLDSGEFRKAHKFLIVK
jgi:VWFA-related protein